MVGGESLPRGFTWVAPSPESLGIKKTFSTVNSPVYSLNTEAQWDSIALEAKKEIDFIQNGKTPDPKLGHCLELGLKKPPSTQPVG